MLEFWFGDDIDSSAVYMPFWLFSMPKLSLNAKIVYGRLLLLLMKKGDKEEFTVSRSLKDLAKDVGMSYNCIQRAIRELKHEILIETYRVELGGVNYYRFLGIEKGESFPDPSSQG